MALTERQLEVQHAYRKRKREELNAVRAAYSLREAAARLGVQASGDSAHTFPGAITMEEYWRRSAGMKRSLTDTRFVSRRVINGVAK